MLVGEKAKLFLVDGSPRRPCHRAKAKPDRLVARSVFSASVSAAVTRANGELAIARGPAPASPAPASVPASASTPATSSGFASAALCVSDAATSCTGTSTASVAVASCRASTPASGGLRTAPSCLTAASGGLTAVASCLSIGRASGVLSPWSDPQPAPRRKDPMSVVSKMEWRMVVSSDCLSS